VFETTNSIRIIEGTRNPYWSSREPTSCQSGAHI
jgi:hypothetical protein